MAKDTWDEFSNLTIRLGWLERELAACGVNSADRADLIEEIQKVSARRDTLVTALGQTTSEIVLNQPATNRSEPLLIGF